MLRVVAFLLLPAALLIACSTAPSTTGGGYADNGQLMGELVVNDRFIILGSPDARPVESILWPGRFVARLDRLRSDLLVIDVDAPGLGDLTVSLANDAGEFPVGTGSFSFTESQHDLPYTIYGEHEVCHLGPRQDIPQNVPQNSCYALSDGEMVCGSPFGQSRAPGLTQRSRYLLGEILDITFVDAETATVVAQFSAGSMPQVEEWARRLAVCN